MIHMPKNLPEIVDLTLELHAETKLGETDAGAILVSEDGGDTKVWLPKSQVEIHERDDRNGVVKVLVPVWLARQSKFAGF